MEEKFYVISFESTHYAIMTEKKLKEKHPVEMIPTPRCITASCGLSLKIEADLLEDVISSLKSFDPDPAMFHLYQIVKTDKGNQAKGLPWEEV